MAAKAKKQPTLVTINRRWQLIFTVSLVATQLLGAATMLWMFTRHGSYISGGTWAFQISTWLYPLPFLAAAYLFVRKRILGFVPTTFWMVFLTTIGVSSWYAIDAVLNAAFNVFNWWPQAANTDRSWWSAFGITWTEMFVVFVLYCLGLWLVTRQGKRR